MRKILSNLEIDGNFLNLIKSKKRKKKKKKQLQETSKLMVKLWNLSYCNREQNKNAFYNHFCVALSFSAVQRGKTEKERILDWKEK